MFLDFEIDEINIAGVKLPLSNYVLDSNINLLPQTLIKASPSRIQDFIAGRICAFRAATAIGYQLDSLPRLDKRMPAWPKEISGSITHSKKFAFSCVASKENYQSIGLDAEEIIDEKVDIINQVANAHERDLIDCQLKLTILFSAKESLFKALNPLTDVFIDFKDVELVSINEENHTFQIKILSEILKSKGYESISGCYRVLENTVITLITIKYEASHARAS